MKSDIEIWYEKKLKEGISKEVLLGALRQQNYSESQIDNLSHKMDQYINEMSNIKYSSDNIKEDGILNRKLQIEADLTSWYQSMLNEGYDKDKLIQELQKQGYDYEVIKRITR